MKIADRILVITDILLAALHSDATISGQEANAARALLADLLLTKADELPEHVEERIQRFRIVEFSMQAAVSEFLADPPMRKRRLLELVGLMVHADGELNLSEDDFMRRLADSLGMEPSEYSDLVLEYEISKLRDTFDELRQSEPPVSGRASTVPPPIPDDARHDK